MGTLLQDLTPGEVQFLKGWEKANNKKAAELLDVSPATVGKALGTTRKYVKAPSYDILVVDKKNGLSNKQIADKYGVSYSRICSIMKSHREIEKEKPEEDPKPQERHDEGNPAFKRVSMTVYTGKMAEYKIFDNGNVRFRLNSIRDNITLYGDELERLINDLLMISNYIHK